LSDFAKTELELPMPPEPQFTIGTLITRHDLYNAMRASFNAGGFGDDVEWIAIDNTCANQTDAYSGLNQVLNRARGEYVILCHQDLLLLQDGRPQLEARLAELNQRDPKWALAGNAGGNGPRSIVRRITDVHGGNQHVGSFPERVWSLDENFIIVRRDARISFSRDLAGFHFYGTDICLVADMLGFSAWVIDFHLHHLGKGAMGASFVASEKAFRKKWGHALRDRDLQTTCTFVSLSGRSRFKWQIATQEYVALRLGRLRRSLAKRRKSASA
jgi:hypothetical protein